MRRMTELRLILTAGAMLGIMAVAACDGENLFSVQEGPIAGRGEDTEAPVVEINSPRGDTLSAKPIGDSVFVSAHVTDDVGVSTVRMYGVALRGDKDLGTDTVVERFQEKLITLSGTVEDTTLTRYLIPTPDSVKETAIIVVEATDSVGNLAADSVELILGGPDVELLDLEDGQSVQAGLNMGARIRAQDPQGIAQVRLEISGAFEQTVIFPISPPEDSVLVDTAVVVPDGITGTIEVLAVARNNLDVSGLDGPITLNVLAAGAGDTLAPNLTHTATSPERMELQDSMIITLTGSDDNQGSGVQTAGYTVLAISPSRADTLIRSGERTFSPARTGTVSTSFAFPAFNVDSLNLPDTLIFEVTTYMVDADGNCGASVGGETPESFACGALATGETVAASRTGERITRSVVAGRTVLLPSGGKIMDAVVDTLRRNLLLSNIEANQVEVFRLQDEVFLDPIGVGSEPWGMTLNICAPLSPTTGCGDTLQVGNSGGTNISNVYLGPADGLGPAADDPARRLLTPDVALFDVELQEDDAGNVSYDVTFHPQVEGFGFSDRPQFVARDSTGRVLYSTRVVEELDQVSTIRKAEVKAGYLQPEVKIFIEHAALLKSDNFWAVGHVDNVIGGSDVTLVDHTPGDLSATISNTGVDPDDAAAGLAGSDAYVVKGGKFSVENIGFSDTTFVSASGDGGWVVFGEGGVVPPGRVIMYEAATDAISNVIEVTDLMTNAGESVEGIGLNYDGTLGVVRGKKEVAFFTTDLRLQGSPNVALEAGAGAGAVLHPLHANARSLTNVTGEYRPDTHLAFIGTGEGTVDIYDTFRFRRTGRIFIRDVINGPIRASLPFAEDNLDPSGNPLQCKMTSVTDQAGRIIGEAVEIFQGGDFLSPWPEDGGAGGTEDRCVVLKLYATTTAGGVVVINVRKGDILRDHPSRN
ncbi:MAG: hypothetical protein ACE5GJ_01900 [Gemmatimonadota bacterium]